jgi:flagellar biogenesis protein FliO
MAVATVDSKLPGPWKVGAFWKLLASRLAAMLGKVRVQKRPRSLQVEETVSLGERRFLAMVHWGNEILLLGVTPHGISLLDKKDGEQFTWAKGRGA